MSPTPQTNNLHRTKTRWGWIALISAIIAIGSPLAAIGNYLHQMTGAFAELSQTGKADPTKLANHISAALLTTAYSLLLTIPALGLSLYALIRYLKLRKHRKPT